MSHSITMLQIRTSPRADEILAHLAMRLNLDHIQPDHAGRAQLWLHLDEPSAHDTVIAALDETAEDWRGHITVPEPPDRSNAS
jgi:hypothetical protein